MQTLTILQALWSMQALRGAPQERSLEDNIARIKGAGFGGFSSMWDDEAVARRAAGLARAEGLIVEGVLLPTSVEAMLPALDWGSKYGLHHLNVQLNMRPRRFEEAVAILHKLLDVTRQADFPVYVETHRGRLTNDLLVTLDLLDAVPEVRLLADLSHYVVAREVELPVSAEIDAQIEAILARSWAFHGRVAGSGQVQLPLSYPHSRPWIDQFAAWWARGFASWRRRADASAELTFTCELGPQPYAIPGPDGQDLTDRWQESLAMRDLVRGIWQRGAA